MAPRLPISGIVTVKNEARNIARTIESAREFLEEVVVVDSNSSDDTREIARASGVRVVTFTWNGRYPKKKQWCLENVSTEFEWILFLDGDERLSEELAAELVIRLPKDGGTTGGFLVPIRYVFSGRALRHGAVVRKCVLMHRHRARFPQLDDLDAPGMGELEGHYQPIVSRRIKRLRQRLIHDDVDSVSTWFDRHNRYSDWEARIRMNHSLRADVRRHKTVQGRVLDHLPAKPLIFFLYCYVFRMGFLDGRAGFDYAFALATYRWQIGVKYRELQRNASSGRSIGASVMR